MAGLRHRKLVSSPAATLVVPPTVPTTTIATARAAASVVRRRLRLAEPAAPDATGLPSGGVRRSRWLEAHVHLPRRRREPPGVCGVQTRVETVSDVVLGYIFSLAGSP